MAETLIDTGLIVEPANQPAKTDVTAAVTPAVPAVAEKPPEWDIPDLTALARDVAIQMVDLPVILEKHEITPEQYAKLQENTFFKQLVTQAAIEWNSPASTNQRLALQAAALLEDHMPDMASRIKNTQEPLPGVVQAAALLTKIAGIGEAAKGPAEPGEKFTITINMGDTKQVIEATAAKTVEAVEVRTLPEGPSDTQEVLALPQGNSSTIPV